MKGWANMNCHLLKRGLEIHGIKVVYSDLLAIRLPLWFVLRDAVALGVLSSGCSLHLGSGVCGKWSKSGWGSLFGWNMMLSEAVASLSLEKGCHGNWSLRPLDLRFWKRSNSCSSPTIPVPDRRSLLFVDKLWSHFLFSRSPVQCLPFAPSFSFSTSTFSFLLCHYS